VKDYPEINTARGRNRPVEQKVVGDITVGRMAAHRHVLDIRRSPRTLSTLPWASRPSPWAKWPITDTSWTSEGPTSDLVEFLRDGGFPFGQRILAGRWIPCMREDSSQESGLARRYMEREIGL